MIFRMSKEKPKEKSNRIPKTNHGGTTSVVLKRIKDFSKVIKW